MKNIYRIFVISVLAAVSFSCKEYTVEKPTIDAPAQLAFTNGTFYGASSELVALEPNSKTVSLQVHAKSISDQNLLISVEANKDMVAVYNEAHGTDYELLPSGGYSIPEDPMILPRYNTESSVMELTLMSENLTDESTYLLPISISEVEGSENYQIVSEESTVYYLFRKKAVPTPVNLNRSNWKILYCSSWRKDSGKGAHPQSTLFDSDVATYWTYNNNVQPPLPIYIVLDLGAEKTFRSMVFSARIKTDGVTPWGPPARGKVEFSNSLSDLPADASELTDIDLVKGMTDSDWTGAEDFHIKSALTSTVEFQNPHNARYVRITFNKAHNNGSDENYKGLQLAELDFMGYETPFDFDL